MGKTKDLTGMRFGRLTVIQKDIEMSKKKKRSYWICQCDCGNITKPILCSLLVNGSVQSCGCLHKEISSKIIKKQNEKQWQDEEYRKMMKQVQSNNMSNLWQNEEFRQKKGDNVKEQNKQRWEDEEYSKFLKDRMKDGWNNDEAKQKKSDESKKRWQNEEYRRLHSGENHWNYNHNLTDEDRQDRRFQDGYDEWTYNVKKQYNFTCDCCGDNRGGNLVSHHLDGYDWCKERRIDVTNGVCLCESCHKEFHHIYGYGSNTKEQYEDFRANKLD